MDGAGGYADITCRFEITPSQAYVARAPGESHIDGDDEDGALFPTGYKTHWRTDTGAASGVSEITTRPPQGWSGLPPGAEPDFEFVIPVIKHRQQGRRVLFGLAYHADGRARIVLSPDKRWDTALARLSDDERWSDWLYAGSGVGRYAYRFRLIELEIGERRRLWLYRSAGHQLTGFSRPDSVSEELLETLGPFVEWSGAYDLMNGLVDFQTQLEIYRQHTDWIADAIRTLTSRHPWQGFFMQWHVIEYAHHLVGASLDTDHPLHDPNNAARDVEWLGEVYGLADRLLAAVDDAIDDDTLLVVASDHGHDLVHTVFYINHLLCKGGWLNTTCSNGQQSIDWSRSKAYGLFPGIVVLNRKQHWSGGTVDESEVEALRADITAALRDVVDPRTGRRPVKMVLDRDDLESFGQWGPLAPDLFFCMDRGYEPATRIDAPDRRDVEFEITEPYRDVTSGHGSFFPASPSARTFALFAGPGFEPGSIRNPVIQMVDLAPTMAAQLGIAPPQQCDGQAVASRLKTSPGS